MKNQTEKAVVTSLQFCKSIMNKSVFDEIEDGNSSAINEILFITSYPARECGIATYSFDLINAIQEKFGKSFSLKVCALEAKQTNYQYSKQVKYILATKEFEQYYHLAQKINADKNLKLIFIQHEFGLFGGDYGEHIVRFLSMIQKPVITSFHTVLPNASIHRKKVIETIVSLSKAVIVMTKNAASILQNQYEISKEKITVIPHGTHIGSYSNQQEKKVKKHFGNHIVLSTFGLLSSGKSIETSLDAMPAIIEQFPNVIFLIIGKTHPEVIRTDGEVYRDLLEEKIIQLNLQNNVRFINKYLPLEELLEYLQLTDIYLFTSKDPQQAVSGSFVYAMSGGCAIVSTPIPHAKEILNKAGIIVDFENSNQLAAATITLLSNPNLLQEMRLNALHKIRPTVWQNSAIAHVELMLKHIDTTTIKLQYQLPAISLDHLKRMTTNTGMIQFANISIPDIQSGYTLDDNARALIATVKHYALTEDIDDLYYIDMYLSFIVYCQQIDGSFLNYVDSDLNFFAKNNDENLEDSNGRAIWALGEFITNNNLFSEQLIDKAIGALILSIPTIKKFHSPRAIAFAIKGLHHYNNYENDIEVKYLIIKLADNLVSKYRGVSDEKWNWFEEYLTYANSLLPEALLCAYLSTKNELFKITAKESFDFLLSIIFQNNKIKIVSNQGWHLKGKEANQFGEQPIDVAYTILALGKFYNEFKDESYLSKMKTAFNWFLGDNHLHQIMYNPSSGGCYDGLEQFHINLNQGAESTVSYLLSRLTIEQYFNKLEHTEHQLYQDENDLQKLENLALEIAS